MQREIKFRGMDANGVMRYGRLSQDKPDTTLYFSEYSQRICWDDSNIPVSNKTLGQYTGLKDKNGKEIFEDDIVEVIDAYGKHAQHVMYTPVADNGDHYGSVLGGFVIWCYPNIEDERVSIEIIGNVWENPDLLNP